MDFWAVKSFKFLLLPLCSALFVLLILPVELQAGEVRVTPRLLTSVTYTDNFEYSSTDKIAARGVELRPGVLFESDGKRVDLRLDYSARNINYDVADDSLYHTLNTFGKVEFVRNLLFVEADGSLTRQPLRGGSDALNLNQYGLGLGGTDVVRYGVSPYLTWGNAGRDVVGILRYRFNSVAYDQADVFDATSSRVSLDISNSGSGQRFSWQGSYLWQQSGFGDEGKVTLESVTLRLVIPIAFQFGFLFDSGYEKNKYQVDVFSEPPEGSFWLAGFRWKPRENLYMQATTGQRFFGSSYALSLNYESAHTLWTLSYIEKVATYLDSLLNAGTGGRPVSSSLLDQVRSSTLQLNQETLLNKVWSTQAIIGKRNRVLTLEAFNRYRQSQLTLSREERSYGGSARLDLRLSSSGSFSLGVLFSRLEDMVVSDQRDLVSGGVEYKHTFSRYLQGFVSYRRTREDSNDDDSGVFSENLVKVSLLFQYAADANGVGAGIGSEMFRKTQRRRAKAAQPAP